MDSHANRSSNHVIETSNLVDKLSFRIVETQCGSKKDESEATKPTSTQKKVQLWNQPSIHPIVRKARLTGRKRTKSFARRSKLSFSKDVIVFEIPSVRDYSPPHRGLVWQTPGELLANMRRNKAEFDAEGRDWRQAVEDEDMYVVEETGEMIHPCWVEEDYSSYDEYSSDDEEMEEC